MDTTHDQHQSQPDQVQSGPQPGRADTPTAAQLVPVPVRLRHRATHGGLVVPWITAWDRQGNPRFGTIDHDRAARAFAAGWCQIDGQPMTDRIVFVS